MSSIETEADLTAVELMRQILPRSQFFRAYAAYDEDGDPAEYEAADEALAEAQESTAVAAHIEAVNAYLGRVEGEDITAAVHLLASVLAKKAVLFMMMHLQLKLGHLPSTEEMTAELDEWEMAYLESA